MTLENLYVACGVMMMLSGFRRIRKQLNKEDATADTVVFLLSILGIIFIPTFI